MKKGFRGALIASAVLFVIGLTLCITSIVAGVDMNTIHVGKKYHGEVEEITHTFTETITGLDLSIRSGEFTVKRGNEFKLEGTGIPKGTIKYSVDNGTLTIEDEFEKDSKGDFYLFHFDLNGKYADKKVTLTIPEQVSLDTVKFSMAAGKCEISDLTSKSAEYYMAAGSFKAERLKHLEQTKLNMDAGSMKIKDSNINNSTMEVNAGELKIDGLLLGKTKAEVNAGSMEIKTELEEAKYSFKTEASLGRIKINGRSGEDIGSNLNAENKMDLECNAGEIIIKTR